ncbi:MAG: HAD family phosphatase [Bacilli bacterium]|nr:HAD family phosphatase [Bacilli bacterium]
MIKLIATDLDGTLFYPKKKIRLLTRHNKKFLKGYVQSGNKLVLVSGRNYPIANRIIHKVKANIDMIACNGAVIYQNGVVTKEIPLDTELVKKLYDENINNELISSWIFMTNKHNMIIVPNGMGTIMKVGYRIGMLCQFRFHGAYLFGKKYWRKEMNNPDIKIYKAMAIYGLGQKAIETARSESLKYQDLYQDTFSVCWSKESIEFMNKDVNKAIALQGLVADYELKNNEIAVVGDSGNDVPLFQSYENSFVMAQAHDDVKKYAHYEIEQVYNLENYIYNI